MRKHLLPLLICFCAPLVARAQVREFVWLNTRQIDTVERSKTVVIVPGGILEEHGPYLPAGFDGIFNQRLADDLATFIASQPGWGSIDAAFRPALR